MFLLIFKSYSWPDCTVSV